MWNREKLEKSYGDEQDNDPEDVEHLERAVEALPHPGQGEEQDEVRGEETDETSEVERLRELLRHGELGSG